MKRQHSGFTLIELLVVFTLLALLLSIALPRYLQATGASREKARSQNMATIRDALDKYKADQGNYPATLDELVTKQYLRNVPVDPVTGSRAWTLLSDPAKATPGVYDIAAPAQGTGSLPEDAGIKTSDAAESLQAAPSAAAPSRSP